MLPDRKLRRPLTPAASGLPLATGELAERDRRELDALTREIHARSGLRCDLYKEKCLRRRLAIRMRARGVCRYADYAAVLRADPQEYERLLATVLINVSKFYRNADTWEAIRTVVLPRLLARPDRPLRIWSAGAAAGEEPYSVAILLLEHAAEQGPAGRLPPVEILGTDIDPDSLAAARRAEYGELALSELPPAARRRWFEPGPPYRLRPEVRRLVRFERADLIADPAPRGQHLVLCRNVAIYFERELQDILFERLADALLPGGFLVLGKVEAVSGPAAARFRLLVSRERIYERI